MAVIYSYPGLSLPTTDDTLVITDASDSNKTKNVSVAAILALGGGTATFYTAGDGLDLTGTVFSTDLRLNSGLKITTTEVDIDLNATDITGVFANYNSTTATNSQNAINNLTSVGAATNEHVLTKDTGSGNAIWKVNPGGTVTSVTGTAPIASTGGATPAISVVLKTNSGLEVDASELSMNLSASAITGTLVVGDGGTGVTSIPQDGIVFGNAASAVGTADLSGKGSIVAGTATTPTPLTVGVDGLFLKADSTQTTGLIWAAGVAGMTSFTASGDGGVNQTISNGDTLKIIGVNGLSTTGLATDTIKINPPYKTDPYAGLGLKGGSGGSFTPSTNLAAWWTLGDFIYVEFYFSWAKAEESGCSGDIILTGLPAAAYQMGAAIDNGNCVIHVNTNMGYDATHAAASTAWVGMSGVGTEMTFRQMDPTTHIMSNSVWSDVYVEDVARKLGGTITYMRTFS